MTHPLHALSTPAEHCLWYSSSSLVKGAGVPRSVFLLNLLASYLIHADARLHILMTHRDDNRYDMVCNLTAPVDAPPNAQIFIPGDPSMEGAPHCSYRIEWPTPFACSVPPPPPPANSPAIPSAPQLQMMDTGLAQFMHFSVDTWSNIEHNCVPVGTSKCLPATLFNPSNLSTDQWVEAAVAMGAGEICLTAHHEGGFCLWDTEYSNYSVMNSPYEQHTIPTGINASRGP